MEKPKQHTTTYYYWSEASKYISYLLKYDIDNHEDKNGNFLCFWHSLLNQMEIHNGSIISLDYLEFDEQWETNIQNKFFEVFGEETEYMASW